MDLVSCNEVVVKCISDNQNLEAIIYSAYKECYSKVPIVDTWEGNEIKNIETTEMLRYLNDKLNSNHESPLEHCQLTFAIKGLSLNAITYLLRHRIASFSQKSLRMTDKASISVVLPESVKTNELTLSLFNTAIIVAETTYLKLLSEGIPKEDARLCLPVGTTSSLQFSFNIRSLFNFFKLRMCTRANWEIRNLAERMHDICMEKHPDIFKHAGPTCKTVGICFEPPKLSCRRAPVFAEVVDEINKTSTDK